MLKHEIIISEFPNEININLGTQDNDCYISIDNDNEMIETKNFNVMFSINMQVIVSSYVPSQGLEHAPEYPEVESEDIAISNIEVYDIEDEPITMLSAHNLIEIADAIKERITYELN